MNFIVSAKQFWRTIGDDNNTYENSSCVFLLCTKMWSNKIYIQGIFSSYKSNEKSSDVFYPWIDEPTWYSNYIFRGWRMLMPITNSMSINLKKKNLFNSVINNFQW